MLNKEVSKTYQIQIREWREIQNILFMIWPILSPHADAHQNFQIFLVPLNFMHIEELILRIAAQCKDFIFCKARLIVRPDHKFVA